MKSIKAIKTEYNGYLFESRLEAKWAVFFDLIGLRWEYEPQGYDVDGDWYCPDFAVGQNLDHFIEIKPSNFNMPDEAIGVYLAGKVCGDSWRSGMDLGWNYARGPKIEGEYHCSTGHDEVSGDGEASPQSILNKCMGEIVASRLFFAWINEVDCFGTLAEIGLARGYNKRVVIGIDIKLKDRLEYGGRAWAWSEESPEYQHDMWFPSAMADDWCWANTPQDAYSELVPQPQIPRQIRALSGLGKSTLACGDPLEARFQDYRYPGNPHHSDYGTLFYGHGLNVSSARYDIAAAQARKWKPAR